MDIVHKVRAVEKLFKTLEKDVQKLKDQTGIHCVDNCIKCCTTPKIMATAVEFYPLAYYLYKNGLADSFLSNIEQIHDGSICPALNRFSIDGSRIGCSFYEHRGLICRLFTYNYHTDKNDRRLISACKTIKTTLPDSITKANEILQRKPIGPKATEYYQKLQFIDFYEAQRLYPIGDAIRIAIETIVTHFHYSGEKAM